MAIVSTLDTLKPQLCGNANLKRVYDFLASALADFGKKGFTKKDFKADKRVDLGDGIFAILQTYKLKKFKNAFFETHKKYVDFQITISGAESFIIGDKGEFIVKKPYDEAKDLIIYKPKRSHKILSNPANLCVFFPCDVHAGGLRSKAFRAVDFKKDSKLESKIESRLESKLKSKADSKKDSKKTAKNKVQKVYKIVVKIPVELIDFRM